MQGGIWGTSDALSTIQHTQTSSPISSLFLKLLLFSCSLLWNMVSPHRKSWEFLLNHITHSAFATHVHTLVTNSHTNGMIHFPVLTTSVYFPSCLMIQPITKVLFHHVPGQSFDSHQVRWGQGNMSRPKCTWMKCNQYWSAVLIKSI